MKMVNVGEKEKTERVAVATARIRMKSETLEAIRKGKVEKGNVIEAAKLAAIMATKRTPDVIPLCHPISISGVTAEVTPGPVGIDVRVEVRTVDRTGVEMEALMGATAAVLTIYDMLKSRDRGMVIEKVQLDHKSGGRSGTWDRPVGRARK